MIFLPSDGSIIATQTFVQPPKSHKSSNFNFKPLKLVAMRTPILLLAITAVSLGSCTTAYKTGQTPDDVYYSPTRPAEEYVSTDKKDEDRQYQYSDDQYNADRYLRMRVHNRYRWYDDNDYFYQNSYNYSYYNTWNYWNNPWNPYTSWNYYYNPYCSHVIVGNPHTFTSYSRPRVFNLNTYNTGTTGNTTPGGSMNNNHFNTNQPVRVFSTNDNRSNSNSNSSTGNFLRSIFSGSSNNSSSNNSSSSPNSSHSSSSSSSSSSGSSSSSAPVRRF
jgi:hypothetical protein